MGSSSGGVGGGAVTAAESPPADTPTPGSTGMKREAESLSRDEDGHADGDAAADEDASQAQKKKKTAPGSRGVANLTPEQLAKKRANDREAQRAIRHRTKNQIEALERRIEELTRLKPYQELQAVLRAKEAVERENADIKRQLAAVVGILKPIIGESASDGSRASPAPALVAPVAAQAMGLQYDTSASASPATGPAEHDHASQQGWHYGEEQHQHQHQQQHADPTMAQLHLQRQRLRHGLDMGPERLGLDFLLQPGQQMNRVRSAVHGAQDSPQYHHVPMKHDWTASASSPASRARHNSACQSAREGGREASMPGQSPSGAGPGPKAAAAALNPDPDPDPENLPRYAWPIKNCGPTCPLDSLLLDVLSERRQRAADGLPMHEVVGPRYPSVSSLLNPANSVYSHPLSKVFTDILATFPDISALPERVAVLYVMFLIMRWQVAPTRENYDRLPPWMRPSPAQLFEPHPAWVDHLPFPAMRDALVRLCGPDAYLFDNFFIPFTTTLRLGWPYEDADTLLVVRPDDDDDAAAADEVVINPVFERHLRNLDNWRLGDRFVRAFPALADTCNIDTGTGAGTGTAPSVSR